HAATFDDLLLVTFSSPATDNLADDQRLLGDYQQMKAVGDTFYGAFTANGASFGRAIADQDPIFFKFSTAIGQVQLGSTTFSVNENGASASVTVSRTGGSFGTATVRLTTADGTARAGLDYAAVDQIVAFDDGDTEAKTIQVPILDDQIYEAN